MKTNFLSILILGISAMQFSLGQISMQNEKAQEFPFIDRHWTVENEDTTEGEINALNYKSRKALKLGANQKAYLKNKKFKNFVLEFYCNALLGPGLGFRIQDRKNFEYLFMRLGPTSKSDALQYLPVHNGNLPWQLYNYPKYEGKATFPNDGLGSLPLSLADQLAQGKISEKLREALDDIDLVFSEEAQLFPGDESKWAVVELSSREAVLIEKRSDSLKVSDFRSWMHVKVKVIEDRASVYIEDMTAPIFVVDHLKRDTKEGGISLINEGYYDAVTITEIESTELVEIDITQETLSSNYLTKWNVSEMFSKDSLNFVEQIDSLFQNKNKFKSIQADADGLLNISRFYDDMTKTVALTCSLVSDIDKTVKLNFDYADHLVILLNSAVLFDKGMNFQPPSDKGEQGRVCIDDESVELNLKKGENELILMLSGDNRQKYNWGFIAKLEEGLKGVTVE